MISDLIHIFFPRLCAYCDRELLIEERFICLSCSYKLPLTNWPDPGDNPLSRKFWAKIDLVYVDAYTHYRGQGMMQKLLHKLKYHGQAKIGVNLGSLYGRKLKNVNELKDVDCVVPVPLHKRKESKRTYNQSAKIAQGIAGQLDKPMLLDLLIKKNNTESQTKRDLFERWQNTEAVFQINRKFQALNTKHMLLVDDVITTGSTLISCAETLKRQYNCNVSAVAVAFTEK